MSLIGGITTAGSLPALEAMIRFSGSRHRLIASNIANIDTPDYRPRDVDPSGFQRMLAEAIDRRRRQTGGDKGELRLEGTGEVRIGRDGSIVLDPDTPSGNVLFHDRNDRDLERLMQDLAENSAAFRVATDLYRHEMDRIRGAIRETR